MSFGLTVLGLQIKRQSDIIAEIQSSLRSALGQNINLLPASVFGQLVGIFSEREALIWELVEDVYLSQYPNSAEGASLDNILALSGLKRLPATPSRVPAPNQVLLGAPGTFIPAGSVISVLGTPTSKFNTDTDVTIGFPQDCIQSVSFSSVPDSGVFKLVIVDTAGNTLTTQNISYLASAVNSKIKWSSVPTSGQYKIAITKAGVTLTTGFLNWNDNSTVVQAAVQALTGYSGVLVTGSFASGWSFTWGSVTCIPTLAVTNNSLLNGIIAVTATPIDSVQAALNNLHDILAANYPYTDVGVSGSYSTNFLVTFGANSPLAPNPASGDQPQNLFTETGNTLQTGFTSVNIILIMQQVGLVAEGTTSMTCQQNGPIIAPAGLLSVIESPVTGWNSTTNLLDAVPGTNIETDTDARLRRIQLLGNQGTATLQAIVAKVSQVLNVVQVIGFENLDINPDLDGRPPKSFEIVARGGVDLAIAQAIYDTKPAGIQAYGTDVTETIFDSAGFGHIIQFSRPVLVPIYVSVTITKNGQFPLAGADLVKEDIVTRGNQLLIGQEVIVNGTMGLSCAFDEIPGILDFDIFVGTSPNPVLSNNIPIGVKELASFDTSRVVVTLI